MAQDKGEEKEKKVKKDSKKKEKRSEKDGVHKNKKDKKDKTTVNGDGAGTLLHGLAAEKPEPTSKADGDGDVIIRDAPPIAALVPFANPLADEKVQKKVLKSVRKAAKNRCIKRGVKEVVKAVRKSPFSAASATAWGVVILAADISPMDVISHIPVLCEDHNIPYIYVTSRAELGAAGCTKRPTSVVLVSPERAGKKKLPDRKTEGKDADEDEEDFADVYKSLVKVVEKESRNVRV